MFSVLRNLITGFGAMRTPGIRRALRKMAARRRSNRRRLAAGKKPILNNPRTGKPQQVSKATFRKRTGVSASKTAAQKRQRSAGRK